MGSLAAPSGSIVYLDANSIIYSVERIAPYHALLQPIWQGAATGMHSLMTSGLSLLETLVGPLKSGDPLLEAGYRNLLTGASDVRLAPITESVLERAAEIRATTNLKTPDAIHAATAFVEGCAVFVTNDPAFRRISALSPGMTIAVLDDLIAP